MVDVYRKVDRVGRWRWQGTIEYRGTPEATAHPDPEVPVPALALEVPGAVYARTRRGLTRKSATLDAAERGSYWSIEGRECEVTIERRPAWCDRGRYIAKVHPHGAFALEMRENVLRFMDARNGPPTRVTPG